MNPEHISGLPPNNNNPQGSLPGLPFMPPPLNGAQHNANQMNANNIAYKMENMYLDHGIQQNVPYSNGPKEQQALKAQLPPNQMPPTGLQQSGQMLPPRSLPSGQAYVTEPLQSGQMLPPRSLPSGQAYMTEPLPSGQMLPPRPLPSRQTYPTESGNVYNTQQLSPKKSNVAEELPSDELPPSKQFPPEHMAPSGQFAQALPSTGGQMTPNLGSLPQPQPMQPSQMPRRQEFIPTGQLPPTGHLLPPQMQSAQPLLKPTPIPQPSLGQSEPLSNMSSGPRPPPNHPPSFPPNQLPAGVALRNSAGVPSQNLPTAQLPPTLAQPTAPSAYHTRPNYPPMPTNQQAQNQQMPSNGIQSNQFQPQLAQFNQPCFPGLPPKLGTPMIPPLPGQNSLIVAPSPGQQMGYNNQPGFAGHPQPAYGGQRPLPSANPQQPMGYPGQQNQYGYQEPPKRLDPDHMPSPIQVKSDDQAHNGGTFITNQKGLVPPLVTTDFVVEDRGNASPRYIRASMYNVPMNQDIMKQTAMPFCIVVSPMAETVAEEQPPPLIDFALATGSPGFGPVRCSRCKAYLCTNMRFLDAGRHFHCVFCKATTEVPMEYTQYLNNVQHYGQTTPEMSLGCYEIVATKEYCRNNVLPQPPGIVFCIDVSYNAIRCGMVQLVIGQIKNIVADIPPHQKIGIITYSSKLHFYNLNEQNSQPQVFIVGDISDVFVPLAEGFFVEPKKVEHLLEVLANEIPNMFKDDMETEVILYPAVQAGLEALKAANYVGKLIIFHSSLPSGQAPGKLINRDDRKLLGTEKEKNVLTPQTKAYNELAQECVQAGCGIEIFLCNSSYADVATIGQLARLTGGTLYKYTYFRDDVDGERFLNDLYRVLTRPTAYDAVMRIRTSTGVRATDFYGHFFMSNTTDVELATLDSDKAIGVEIKHDDKLTGEDGVYIQVALLYTHNTGQRRLRICNLALNVAAQIADVYKCCDLDTIINFLTKQAIWRLNEHPPKAIKEGITARTAQSLVCYRKHCASPTSAGQLVLPESMKLLPLYANCLNRSDALNGGSDMTCDDRSWNMQIALYCNIITSINILYPTLTNVGLFAKQQPPQQLRCSAEKITHTSVYLLDNSIHLLLWIGLQTPADILKQLFGVNTVQEVDPEKKTLPILQEPANQLLREYIDNVRVQRKRHMKLTIVRQHDPLDAVFRQFLIEDQGHDGSPSYVDFLCHIHKEIRALL